MRIAHDESRCAATGICESLAPDVFEVGEDGWLVVLETEPAEDRRAAVAEACAACPTGALVLEG